MRAQLIEADSAYDAHNSIRNGVDSRGFLILNFRGEVDSTVKFTFVDNSLSPVTVQHFVVSIYDFDRGCVDGNVPTNKACDGGSFGLGEIVMAKSSTADPAEGFDGYQAASSTEVAVDTASNGWTRFAATTKTVTAS